MSVTKNDQNGGENKENDDNTMAIHVPNSINKVVIIKNGKRYCLEILTSCVLKIYSSLFIFIQIINVDALAIHFSSTYNLRIIIIVISNNR